MLNLNGSLTKAGVTYSTLWSEDFTDEFFLNGLRQWLAGEPVRARHSATSRPLAAFQLPAEGRGTGRASWPRELRRDKAIMGVFDEGCMGMYNAIIPDELLHADGRVQGAAEPVGAVRRDAAACADAEARAVRALAGRARACSFAPARIRRPI